uniref:Uncharacterized protein n=1 Tax=Setaria italica TaxID=4555 RepID=K3YFE9_SETIT
MPSEIAQIFVVRDALAVGVWKGISNRFLGLSHADSWKELCITSHTSQEMSKLDRVREHQYDGQATNVIGIDNATLG